MNAVPNPITATPIQDQYRLLEPAQKYTRAFCTDEEIAIAEHIRAFVNKELMPYRHDLEGGWHRDEKLAKETLHRLYAKLVDLGVTKTNLPEKFGGLAYSPVIRQMINEELSRADIGLATMVGKIHWIVSVMAAAPHPNAARLLVHFILSGEGQQILADYGGRSFLPSVTVPVGLRPTEQLKLLHSDPAEVALETEAIRKRYTQLFGV